MIIHDDVAVSLEAKGLYRRAAERWAEVMMLVDTDREREEAARRRSECIRKSRPPAPPEKLSAAELKKALRRTQKNHGDGGYTKESLAQLSEAIKQQRRSNQMALRLCSFLYGWGVSSGEKNARSGHRAPSHAEKKIPVQKL